jgi:hypothetical protein
MREALMLQLEKFCYYQHLSLSGGQERPIFACRIVDIRGTRFHVLSRIQDAGLDFTGRTNFIVHHLVFTPEEIRQFSTPPVILRDWPGWLKSWTKEPQLLENEDWAELTALAGKTNVPAQTWQRVTGDAVNGYGLLEARAGASFRVDDQPDETILELLAESLELLEVRDTRRDFRTAAWNYTFTTSMQEQDNPADFRWRCIHSDNPAANRFATPDCRALSAVRASRWTDKEKEKEEAAFARTGRQPPRFVKLSSDKTDIQEGAAVRLEVTTDGIPTPTIRWFEIERNEPKELVGKSGSIQNLNPEGRSKRYQVQAYNNAGSADSNVVEISIRAPVRVPSLQRQTASTMRQNPVDTTDENPYETLNQTFEDNEARQKSEFFIQRILVIVFVCVIVGVVAWLVVRHHKANEKATTAALTNSVINVTGETNLHHTTVQTNQPNPLQAASETKAENPKLNPKSESLATTSRSANYGLPEDWLRTVIGSVTYQFAECVTNNAKSPPRFDLTASAEGFQTNDDNVLFVCKANTGNEFKATLQKIDSPAVQNRCGIMIRESRKNDSPFLFIGASSEKIYAYCRDAKGGFFAKDVDIPKAAEGATIILKFSPKDKQFVPVYSFNSTNWPSFPEDYVISNSTQTLVGFAISSGSSSNRVTAHFFDVSPKK